MALRAIKGQIANLAISRDTERPDLYYWQTCLPVCRQILFIADCMIHCLKVQEQSKKASLGLFINKLEKSLQMNTGHFVVL